MSSTSSERDTSSTYAQERLYLTEEEARGLEDLADQVVLDTLAFYDRFRFVEKRVVNSEAWKDVGRRDNLIVYRERSGPRPTYPSIRDLDGRLQIVPCRSAPSVKIVGWLQGTLEDEMYGLFADTDDSVQMRSSYVNDTVEDFHWLANIAEPTQEDPFRYCGVARCTLGRSLPIVKTRDACAVVSMGMTTTKHGERLGYYVVHSVDLSEPASNRHYVRAKASLCWLKCEQANGKVELYMKGFAAPMGIVPEFAAFPVLVTAVLGVAQTSDAAYSKKLHWMIRDTADAGHRTTPPPMDEKAVCSTCQVVRKIPVEIVERRVTMNRCSLCILCMHRAKTASSVAFARREMRSKRWKSIDNPRMSITDTSEDLQPTATPNVPDRAFFETR
ncbi:hypothetical protein PHYBOEH_004596 [Phytophthora boehmeriae]|uniref:START domain-containing protein n=1 Tax=Phytophthora boehmeriae TaxID=109152 RepID=A0A8T1WSY4_9STRA|nr:hypothetical protein PHYBOEH_004596 [Phytophthora boehmeriae]